MANRQTQNQQRPGSRNQGTTIPDDDEDQEQGQLNVTDENPDIRQNDGNRASQQNTAADIEDEDLDDDADSNDDDAGEDDEEDEEEGGGAGQL